MWRSLSEARAQGGRSSGCKTLMLEHPDCSFSSLMVTPPLPMRLPACVAQMSILHCHQLFKEVCVLSAWTVVLDFGERAAERDKWMHKSTKQPGLSAAALLHNYMIKKHQDQLWHSAGI